MVLILIESTDSLAINYQAVKWFPLSILKFYRLAPDPKSLCAWIYCWTNTKSTFIFLVEKNAVEQERLACPVLAGHCYHTDSVLFQIE